MSKFDVIEFELGSAVADDGTTTVNYPTDNLGHTKTAGAYNMGTKHRLVSNRYGELKAELEDQFDLTFGTASITVTNRTGTAWAAGTKFWLELDGPGANDEEQFPALPNDSMAYSKLITVSLGAPDTADVDGVFEAVSQAAGDITLDGALLNADGVIEFDVPRNIVVDSGGADTSPITFTGTDVYGNVLKETITLNGTTAVAGKKAFKTITAVSNAATISNGAFAGPGDVLGLPCFLPGKGRVLAELEDGAAATAGTLVAGDTTEPATATSGDVRGTYDPNSACDGSKKFELVIAIDEPSFQGVSQYDG